jgi:hypothetical protein
MQIERITSCAGGLSQVALRCANCDWRAARALDADGVMHLQRDAARDRELIARDLYRMRRASRPALLLDFL